MERFLFSSVLGFLFFPHQEIVAHLPPPPSILRVVFAEFSEFCQWQVTGTAMMLVSSANASSHYWWHESFIPLLITFFHLEIIICAKVLYMIKKLFTNS
jgi:hypothetical protein